MKKRAQALTSVLTLDARVAAITYIPRNQFDHQSPSQENLQLTDIRALTGLPVRIGASQ